jgi:alpha-L-rhamnosidase
MYPKIWPSNAFIGNYLRLECLSREGYAEQILDETRSFFQYMADLTGTLWEHIGTTASCNHGFASHVAVVYCRDVLGLKEIDYVNKTVKFNPPKNIALDSISMDIPVDGNGFIRASWEKTDAGIVEDLRLPSGWKRN